MIITLFIAASTLLPLNSCALDDTQESNTFIELLKLAPADALSSGEIILIDYSKIWDDSGISFYEEDGSRMNREEILNSLDSKLEAHFRGASVFN